MKIKKTQPKNNKKIVIIIAIAVLLLGAASASALYLKHQADTKAGQTGQQPTRQSGSVDYNSATDPQVQAGIDQKERAQSANSNPTAPTNDVSVVITSLNASSSSIVLRSEIAEVTNQGTCTLLLTSGDTSITKQAGIQAGPSTSTCEGFNVDGPFSTGAWHAKLTVTINGRTGIVDQDFTIK